MVSQHRHTYMHTVQFCRLCVHSILQYGPFLFWPFYTVNIHGSNSVLFLHVDKWLIRFFRFGIFLVMVFPFQTNTTKNVCVFCIFPNSIHLVCLWCVCVCVEIQNLIFKKKTVLKNKFLRKIHLHKIWLEEKHVIWPFEWHN